MNFGNWAKICTIDPPSKAIGDNLAESSPAVIIFLILFAFF